MVRMIQLFMAGAISIAAGCGYTDATVCDVVPECQPHEVQVSVCSNSTCRSTDSCARRVLLCETPATPSVDYCELYGWYNDGTCDQFCPNPDPDCQDGECQIWTGCHDYEVEVDSCEGEACRETVNCDNSHAKWCDRSACLEEPVCEPGFVQREGDCAEGESCYQEARCGEYVTCVEVPVTCDAPLCADGSTPTSECAPDDACVVFEHCGVQSYCSSGVQCAAVPTCGDGYVESGTTCPADAHCYEETMCGQTIACRPALGPCEAYPACEEGHNEVPFCDVSDATCVQEEMCGYTIYCQSQCRAIPTCADGYTEGEEPCAANEVDCYQESLCGTTISCRAEP